MLRIHNDQNIFIFSHLASSPVMERSPQNITSLDGQDVTFICNAIGAPIPNTTWLFNGKELNVFYILFTSS